jgi:hypothetical protein
MVLKALVTGIVLLVALGKLVPRFFIVAPLPVGCVPEQKQLPPSDRQNFKLPGCISATST